jgi:PleD family two-component response regulator
VHAGDHLAQHLTVKEPNKFKQLVPAARNLEMPCSGLNAGTRFFVSLWDAFQNLGGLCEPMRILVAEDDAPLAEFLHQRLEQEQFAVQVVSNGAEAQQVASHQPYDLVILDLHLPGAGGLDVLL